ncbi:MAG TPA: MopE-related protein [Kofleriaceae bacterium]|nr:MopE-related protein [Kofleriaceae bacterium]
MGKLLAWSKLAALAIIAIVSVPEARAGDPLKPYVVLALDTSGSMLSSTGVGPPSCGGPDTRLNHARCAINNIVNSYGDMVFALGRFRMTMSGTYPSCSQTGPGAPNTATCNGTADMFELLTPLVDGNNELAAVWTDGTYNTCTASGTDPEVWHATGNTPLAGTLVGAKHYWSGLQAPNHVIWPANEPGFAPIENDPFGTAFLPGGCDPSPDCTVNCCASQCRPYIVILLTDGAETCVPFDPNTPNAAAALLSTDVATGSPATPRRYRIETKPIGFGIAPPTPPAQNQIEDIAQAGGAPDLPGLNEGYYASDENGLQLAISAILADAIKTEVCNDLDDDCDAAIDEDFPGKGGACDNGKLGVCRRTGDLECRPDGTGLQCNAPAGPSGSAEVCNNLDDDCDGKTDEGLTGCTCVPQGEQCNNVDDDCDSAIDENLQRPCGTGTCQGVETCTAGTWGGCTAPQAGPEVCNGLDDNCDGLRDGFTETCSDMSGSFPPLDPRNNPGDPSNSPIPQNICRPGLRTCPANVGPPNDFGPCLQEQQPLTEVCNNLDDDCDNLIDEGTGGADCSTSCGVGVTVCVNGMLQCDSVTEPDDDTCDGVDDDCDMMIDEDYVSSGACGTGQVCNGMEQCVNGTVVCVGTPVAQESCNCTDDDCDAAVDEGALCPAGTACVNCQCAPPCIPGEFPCALGKICVDNHCVADVCFGVTCPDDNGNKQVCRPDGNAPTCISACDPSVITCPSPLICHGPTGECKADDCTTFPERCSASEVCLQGTCVANPCAGVNCPGGQYCVGGSCVASCADVECPDGQRCRIGMCETDPCGQPCPFGKVCDDPTGECVSDPCQFVQCPQGQECDPHRGGVCVDSLCNGTMCPEPGQICKLGTCYDPGAFRPDAGSEYVTTGGGGGCSAGGGGAGLLVGLLGLGLALARRGGRALLAMAMVAAAALPLSCGVNDYCIGCPVGGDGGGSGDGGPGDGGSDGPPCVPGNEVCDGKDNDCDGSTDEGPLPEIGDACPNQVGECQGAVKQCVAGTVSCTREPRAEICDNKDNNCNGMIDEGNPGGGASCGSDAGECVAGVTSCDNGTVVCIGAVGGGPEICNGRDDDCDMLFDEGLTNMGSCGITDVGECSLGTLMCMGGGTVCVGAVGPTFEICDMLDQDCDGDPTNGFDLATDPTNCGMCGNICNLPNAYEGCAGGMCTISACQPGYHDNDGLPGTGCEFGPCTIQSTQEVCNGADDNCNGMIDEDIALPSPSAFCRTAGECATGTTVTCDGAGGLRCHYADPDVSTDAMGNITPETLCDGKDNDCDGVIDEGQPNLGQACDNGLAGDCRDTGTYQCNPAAPDGPAVCVITQQGPGMSAEACDGRDNDCNGTVDDGAATGDLPGQEWVSIAGTTVEIMKYEASRPDATATSGGAQQAHACARPGVQPWTNLTYPQAVAACESIGARLCTENEWERMCAPRPDYPVAGPGPGEFIYFEAEDAFENVTVAGRNWQLRPPYQDSSGSGYVVVGDSGVTITAANAPTQAPRLVFQANLAASLTYNVWVRMMGAGSGSDSVWVGLGQTQPGTANSNQLSIGSNLAWRWVSSTGLTTGAAGTYFINVYMREDGTSVDAVALARAGTTPPPFGGKTWAYEDNRKVAQPQACNGDDYDTTPGGADDDDILPTGSLPSCFANGPGTNDAYDMSGNVKEWTAARAQGQNPIRGGASNNETAGLACELNFTLADDTFFFPNVGFRCCR